MKWFGVKWKDLKGDDKTSKSGGKWKMGSEVNWSEVKVFGGMCLFSWIYSYVLCMWVTVQYVLLLSECLIAICYMSFALYNGPIFVLCF